MRGIEFLLKRPGALRLGVCIMGLFCFSTALACSTVAFPNNERPLLAYNFDFKATGAGFLLINPAGAVKRSVMDGNAASWTSKIGSITLNQIGPGMPVAGMNTAGLVVSLMWNQDAIYADTGDAPVLSELEFIQRLLDTSGSVAEALSKKDETGIRGLVPIHYFLFDASGRAATLTPTVDGLLIHEGENLPVPALTNTSYAKALMHLRDTEELNDKHDGSGSLDRFRIAAAAVTDEAIETPAQAFDVLDKLANSSTRWQVVFDPLAKRITLRVTDTQREFDLDLAATEFTCTQRPLGTELRKISSDFSPATLSTITEDGLAATLSEVLSSMKSTAHLGRPEVAAQLSAELLAASECTR